MFGINGNHTEDSGIRHANSLESVLTYEGTREVHTPTVGKAITGVGAFR